MGSESRANTRYGLTESALAPVSRETAQAAYEALTHVTAPERCGKHWRLIANEKGAQDLLVVFATGLPPATPEVAYFAPEPRLSYEATLAPVLEALDGAARAEPSARVLVTILRAVSPGQTQAVYSRTPTMLHLLASGRRWTEAQKGRPALRCAWRDGDGRRRLVSPEAVVRLLSRQYGQTRDSDAAGPSPADIFDFLLADDDDRRTRADALLREAVSRGFELLAGIGGAILRGESPPLREEVKGPTRAGTADRFAFLLALLLDGTDRTMTATASPPAYLLGLLLALADTLHATYGRAVRGSVPPTLVGNSLLGIARDDPARALAELLERIRPWQAWAETAEPTGSDAKEILKAKKALSRLSRVAPLLSGALPTRMADPDRAELLLGYLSKDSALDEPTNDPSATLLTDSSETNSATTNS